MKAREFWVYRSMSGYDDMVTPFVPKENWEGWSEDFIHVREVLPDDELEKLRAENIRTKKMCIDFQERYSSSLAKIEQLRAASKVLRDCLKEVEKDICANAQDTLWCHEGYAMTIVDRIQIDIAKFDEMMGGEEG